MQTKAEPSFVEAIPKVVLVAITLPFLALTGFALLEYGFIGTFKEGMQNTATLQILVDLFICAFFFLAWLYKDCKRMKRSFLPWAALTLIAGSFGPLLYLLTRKQGPVHE